MPGVDVLSSNSQHFGLDQSPYDAQRLFQNDTRQQAGGGGVNFGEASGGQVNFGGPQHAALASPSSPSSAGTGEQNDPLMERVRDLVARLMQDQDLMQRLIQALSQLLTPKQDGNGGNSTAGKPSSGGVDYSPAASGGQPPQQQSAAVTPPEPVTAPAESAAVQPPAAQPAPAAVPTQPAGTPGDVPAQPQSAVAPAPTPTSNPSDVGAKPTEGPQKTSEAAAVESGKTAGSGPYSLNITNTQDRPITIGQFDKNEQKVAELTLQPGEKGTMKYEADTTGLLKQAEKDGSYKPDASRLEFYNGFVNTSYIDGRNAAIHATDGKGFEIGDKESLAAAAKKANLIQNEGDTIPGFYDGSTPEMREGGKFLQGSLNTDMSYIHPDDDQLGPGRNPMRHTDSMSLQVTFGAA